MVAWDDWWHLLLRIGPPQQGCLGGQRKHGGLVLSATAQTVARRPAVLCRRVYDGTVHRAQQPILLSERCTECGSLQYVQVAALGGRSLPGGLFIHGQAQPYLQIRVRQPSSSHVPIPTGADVTCPSARDRPVLDC